MIGMAALIADDDDMVQDERELIRIPTSQQVVRGIDLHRQLRDPTIEASRTRVVRRNDPDMPVVGEELTAMAEMTVRADGGSLRTFSGRMAHENGWWPSFKRRRLQHWQGSAQRNAMMFAECTHGVDWAQTEARRFRFHLDGRWREYTCDLEVDMFDAPTEIWEVKRDDRALEDPDYRMTLAGVDEICRRIGMRFRIVMADEIFASRRHRDNVELVASRRFVGIGPSTCAASTRSPSGTAGRPPTTPSPMRLSRAGATAAGPSSRAWSSAAASRSTSRSR